MFSCSGLVYKKMENYEEALDCFLKLHAILRNNPQVIWQLANLYPSSCISNKSEIDSPFLKYINVQ
jgi:tetratricopeptide (TPR) repeat protein